MCYYVFICVLFMHVIYLITYFPASSPGDQDRADAGGRLLPWRPCAGSFAHPVCDLEHMFANVCEKIVVVEDELPKWWIGMAPFRIMWMLHWG